ncbi:hypothetical protein DL96DRAFT_1615029 [Flagelloscypha sp. PMI_526]|nr:hypothetical protein DL96DRAFT_1615029 [Flagelloscypha sp. PMI_526]
MDLASVIIGLCDFPTVSSFALTNRALLPFSRKHLYHSIEISSKNVSHLLALFTFEDRAAVFEILIQYAIITHLNYDLASTDSDLHFILHITSLPCLRWLSFTLILLTTRVSPLAVMVLQAPQLRKLSLGIDVLTAVPPAETIPLPSIKEVYCWTLESSTFPDSFIPWAGWMNLETVEQMTLDVPGVVLPAFPSGNRLKRLSFHGFPDLGSLISNFPTLQKLLVLTIQVTAPSHAEQILDSFPPNPIYFDFIIQISDSLDLIIEHLDRWKQLTSKMDKRAIDRHRWKWEVIGWSDAPEPFEDLMEFLMSVRRELEESIM